MKITIISDTHNLHNQIKIDPCDILIHCGDMTMLGKKSEMIPFIEWFAKQPAKHKICTMGNHCLGMDYDDKCRRYMFKARHLHVESCRDEILQKMQQLGIIHLENNSVTIDGLKIYGAPDQPAFCGWAFNRTDAQLTEIHKKIPEDTNILITHAPPYGILDKLVTGESVGDRPLVDRLNDLKSLKLHCFGHIHEDYGIAKNTQFPNVTFANASLLDHGYRVRNKPITLDIK